MKKLGDSVTSYMIGVLFSLVPDQRSSEIEKAHRSSRANWKGKRKSLNRTLGDKEDDMTVQTRSLCQIDSEDC